MDRYNNLITEELLSVCDKNDIYVHNFHMKPETPDVCSPNDLTIIINLEFDTKASFNYRLAHELSHVLYGDREAQSVYQFSEFGKRGEELLAHKNAIRLLMSIKFPSSPLAFMGYYSVPAWLENDVTKTYNELNIVE